jgi:hypothetical protein
MLGIGVSLIARAQGQAAPKYTILVFGKLHLTPTGDAAVAERLLKEKLLSAAKGIDGLKITALKRMQLPGQRGQTQTAQPDFVMMAEITDVNVFTKLITTTPGALREYGEQMKVQAGAPQFELYQILGASTE